jgi:hypothetical protein
MTTKTKNLSGIAFALLLVSLPLAQFAHAASGPPFKSIEQLVKWVNAHNKAPFDRDSARLPNGAAAAILRNAPKAVVATSGTHTNVKVTRDRDPWPKAEIGSAVDPIHGSNYMVMTNDFRENFDHMFFHPSTNGGATFTDDSMVGGDDPTTGFIPLTFQSDPGVAFDSVGHSVLSTITGNLIFDGTNGYINEDSEIEVAVGFSTYASLIPTVVDYQPCNGTFTTFTCAIQLDKPLITIDNVPGSPNIGTVYVYYTVFCVQATPCTDGSATIPAFSSAIVESHAPGAGLAFSAPALVSGALSQEQFSDLVVDSHGVPHVFFDDFSGAFPTINMFESTLTGGTWVVNPTPVASFNFLGTASINWGFRINGAAAPGCGIHGDTAYCAFASNGLAGGPAEAGLSAYLATVSTGTGSSTISRVNNDGFNNGKDHFFPWATAKADGSVYVGWYDDRNDPFNTKVQYFVGKSTDGGASFPTQKSVSDVAFNPCVGFPGCGFFGDYTQLVSGPDGVVHAAWSDTRDGASMQVWSQSVTW